MPYVQKNKPMDKMYKLLRDSQQSGPHTLGELTQLGLKPFDMVWADGRTPGWVYAYEIEALAPLLTEEQQEPVEAVSVAVVEAEATIATPDPAPADTAPAPEEPVPETVTPTHVFISLPAGSASPTGASTTYSIAPKPVVQEDASKQKLERKALALKQKVEALAAQWQEEKVEPAQAPRNISLLGNIKEKSANWIHELRGRQYHFTMVKKQWRGVALVLAALGVSYAALQWFARPSIPAAPQVISQAPAVKPAPARKPVVQQADTNRQAVFHPVVATEAIDRNALPAGRQSVINTEVNEGTVQALDELDRDNKRIENDMSRYEGKAKGSVQKSSRVDPPPPVAPDANSKVNEASVAVVNQSAAKPASRPADTALRSTAYRPEKNVPFSRQLDIRARYQKAPRGRGIDGAELMLINNSALVLRTVAIDVFYYKEHNRLVGKETLYFKNVPPRGSLTLTAPGNKRAVSANHKVGLISTSRGVYMAQQ
jgi:hypothetical protein